MGKHSLNRFYEFEWQPGISFLDAEFQGHPYGIHSHEEFSIGAITAGTGGYYSKGASYTFPSGTLALMNPEQAHDGYAVNGNLKYKMLYVSEGAVARLLPNIRLLGFNHINPKDHAQHVSFRLQHIANNIDHHGDYAEALYLDSELVDLLEWVFIHYGRERKKSISLEKGKISTVRDYLCDMASLNDDDVMVGLDTRITLDSLAGHVGLHSHYLLNAFRAGLGIAPYQYFIQLRIASARELLRKGYRPTDIVGRLGFSDQAHFIRSFKHVLGITPRHYHSIRQR